MTTNTGTIAIVGAREIYKLLGELEPHINEQDARGRALLYQAKERLRMVIIKLDRDTTG